MQQAPNKPRTAIVTYSRFPRGVKIEKVDIIEAVVPLFLHSKDHFDIPVTQARAVMRLKSLDAGWLEHDTLSFPVGESRSSEESLFSGYRKLLRALAFLASHGPLTVRVVCHGFDLLMTDIAKLRSLFSTPAIEWEFYVAIHPEQAVWLPKDRKFTSNEPGIFWLRFTAAELWSDRHGNSKSQSGFREALDRLGKNNQLARQAK
jgi:hypothetical protein